MGKNPNQKQSPVAVEKSNTDDAEKEQPLIVAVPPQMKERNEGEIKIYELINRVAKIQVCVDKVRSTVDINKEFFNSGFVQHVTLTFEEFKAIQGLQAG